ncbi:MAG: putative peptidoglycan glycosyltransferase FtsW [Pseudomonadota bacterium]
MMTSLRRTDRTALAEWWWTVDRVSLVAVIALVLIGLTMGLSASIPVAEKKSLGIYHFAARQLVFTLPAIAILISVSFLSVRQICQLAAGIAALAALLVVATLVIGDERNGATRWLDIGAFTLQPSEFLKPAVIVLAAWLLSENGRFSPLSGALTSGALVALCAGLLILQPDFGQAVLLLLVWMALFFVAGMPLTMMAGLSFAASLATLIAAQRLDHVQDRFVQFFAGTSDAPRQIDMSLDAFRAGGLVGQGPGEGVVKQSLPDAHTDFVFAVLGEEFGLVACLLVLGVFGVLMVRGIQRTLRQDDHFVQLASTGLLLLLGLQAFINMAVALNLIPSKGMTLPFISYGGSSLLAVSLTMGLLLALTRRRARNRLAPGALLDARFVT